MHRVNQAFTCRATSFCQPREQLRDNHLRGLLYEAAVVILTRTMADSALRIWGLKLKEKIGFKRAAIAVARKLAVIMHTMLKSGEMFNRSIQSPLEMLNKAVTA
jgi:hypothetical protein